VVRRQVVGEKRSGPAFRNSIQDLGNSIIPRTGGRIYPMLPIIGCYPDQMDAARVGLYHASNMTPNPLDS
jgi:hypothetical protein